MISNRTSGLLSIGAAIGLAVTSYYLAWRSGCVFDAKSGVGEAELAFYFSDFAMICAALCVLALAVSVPLLTKWTFPIILGSILLVGVLAVPLLLLALAAAGTGDASCSSVGASLT